MSEAASNPSPTADAGMNGAAQAPAGEQSWEQIKDAAIAEGEKGGSETPAKGKPDAKPKDGAVEPPKERKPKYSEWQAYEHKLKRLNESQRAFDERRTKGEAELQAVEKRAAELDERAKLLDKLETDPKAFIEHFAKRVGMTPTKVINALNEFFLEQKSPADLEIAKLRHEREEEKRQAAEQKKAAEEKAAKDADAIRVATYVKKIAQYVVDKADDYTHLSTYTPEDVAGAAWKRIQRHYDETGKSLPLDSVLEMLESEEERMFLAKQKRREERQSAGAQKSGSPNREGAAPAANPDAQQRPQTLNHRLAGQRTPPPRGQSDPEDWEEAKRQAGLAR
jgi:hypothetical protein